MKLRKRHLTLLEVLICFTMIILCVAPLLGPHVSYYQTQRQLVKQVEMNLAIANWYASFYEELLKGQRNWDSLVLDTPQEITLIDEKIVYLLTKKKDKIGANKEMHFFEMRFLRGEHSYTYYFVVQREKNEDQTKETIPDPA